MLAAPSSASARAALTVSPWGVVVVVVTLGTLASGGSVASASPATESTNGTNAPALAAALLDQAYTRLGRHDLQGARGAFAAAADAGAPPQRVALELGYLALAERDPSQASSQFALAAAGPDALLARRGVDEARLLPHHLWADLYVESFGWSRSRAGLPSDDLVTMSRARVFVRPSLNLDLHFYGFAQGTRDLASTGQGGAAGLPQIYADNYALFGAGLFVRMWNGRAAAFAQLGPAVNLLDDGRARFTMEVRGGGMLAVQTNRCRPTSADAEASGGKRVSRRLVPCAEGYLEATYVSRFQNNVIGFGRGRAGVTYLTTGPVAWQLLLEWRAAADRNHDYYNNFADVGALQRWRLATSVPVDFAVGAHAGRFLGVSGRDPAPDRLGYVDLRLVGSTYVAF